MKSKNLENLGEVLKDMGFNNNSSQSTKAAFLKHLIKQAYNVDVKIPDIYKAEKEGSIDSLFKRSENEQMEFVFEDEKAS